MNLFVKVQLSGFSVIIICEVNSQNLNTDFLIFISLKKWPFGNEWAVQSDFLWISGRLKAITLKKKFKREQKRVVIANYLGLLLYLIVLSSINLKSMWGPYFSHNKDIFNICYFSLEFLLAPVMKLKARIQPGLSSLFSLSFQCPALTISTVDDRNTKLLSLFTQVFSAKLNVSI